MSAAQSLPVPGLAGNATVLWDWMAVVWVPKLFKGSRQARGLLFSLFQTLSSKATVRSLGKHGHGDSRVDSLGGYVRTLQGAGVWVKV